MSARELSKVDELNVTVSNGDEHYKVSAEAQYLFEIQVYFNTLNDQEQDKTIDYFAKSNDSLDKTVADTLRKTQESIRGLRDGTIKINRNDYSTQANKLLDPNFVIDGTTEIGVRPNGPEMFRLDGKKDYNLALGSEQNDDLKKQLDTLEKTSSHLLRNRDAANVFGSVSNALVYADNILLSADDVLHYNYAIEQAQKTIEFVTAPDDLKATLTDILSKSIAWQDAQQSKTIFDNRKLIDNARVGHLAADAVRMGSAAQAFNQQLISSFKSSENSFLESGSLIKRMLAEQPDLIRFGANKIDEALAFYRDNNTQYDKALNRGYYEPTPEWKDPLTEDDRKIFAASKNYALKVITEIQGYVTNQQT